MTKPFPSLGMMTNTLFNALKDLRPRLLLFVMSWKDKVMYLFLFSSSFLFFLIHKAWEKEGSCI